MSKTVKTSEMAQRRAAARASDDPEYNRRRNELRHAAARVFRDKGYSATNLNDIASEIGIDRATLYYYVSGKEELFRELVFDAARANVQELEDIVSENITAIEKMYRYIRTLMHSFDASYPYLYLYIQENMVAVDDKSPWASDMRELVRRYNDAVIAIVHQGLEDGEFRSRHGDAALLAHGIAGMINWTYRWYQPGKGVKAEQVSAAFSEMILMGLTR